MACAVCGQVVGLNKQYGDLEFCPNHSEKDLPQKPAETKTTSARGPSKSPPSDD